MSTSSITQLSHGWLTKQRLRRQALWGLAVLASLTVLVLYWNQNSQVIFEDPIKVAESFAVHYLAGDRHEASVLALPTATLPKLEEGAVFPGHEAVSDLGLRLYRLARLDEDFVATLASPRLAYFDTDPVVLVLHLKPDMNQLSYLQRAHRWAELRKLARFKRVPTRWKVARVLFDTNFHARYSAELKKVEEAWRQQGENFLRDVQAKVYKAAVERLQSWASKSYEDWKQWAQTTEVLVDAWAYEEGTKQFTEVLRTIATEQTLLAP